MTAGGQQQRRYRKVYDRDGIVLYHGDCLDVLPTLQADVVITDPPYTEQVHSRGGSVIRYDGGGNNIVDSVRWSDLPC